MKKNRHPSRFRRLGTWFLVAVLAVIGAGIYYWKSWAVVKVPSSETIDVLSDDYVDYVDLRGEITVQSATLIKAPYDAGELQIMMLVRNDSLVKKGEVIVEFDSSSLRQTIEQLRAALAQAESEIDKLKAQQRLQEEKNLTETTTAQFALERAHLDLGNQDLIPAIEYERNVLAVAKAEQKIEELETKLKTYRIGAEADIAGAERKRDKALADLEKAESSLSNLTIRAPIDGILTLLHNSRARTTILSGNTPVFKEGDRLWAGASIAEIPDMSTIQATAPVFEAERGRIELGQPVLIRVEAVPDKEHKGTVRVISPITKVDYSTYPYRKSFELNVALTQPDPRLKTGMSANIQVEVERIPGSIMIPTDSVFEKGGRLVAYVASANGYEERSVQVSHRNSQYVRVTAGVDRGERVALKDPTVESD